MAVKDLCFWCLKPLDLNDTFDKDKDQMRFLSYTPCKRCKTVLDKGIHVMGVQKEQMMPNQPAISTTEDGDPLYPTGAMMAAPEEWVRSFLDDEDEKQKDLLNAVLKQRVMMVPANIMEEILKNLDDSTPSLIEGQDMIEKQQKEGKVAGTDMADTIGGLT